MHCAATVPKGTSEVAGGFLIYLELCVALDLHKWLREERRAYVSKDGVAYIFETIDPSYIMWRMDNQGTNYKGQKVSAPKWLAAKHGHLLIKRQPSANGPMLS